jgi:hypothetical protein
LREQASLDTEVRPIGNCTLLETGCFHREPLKQSVTRLISSLPRAAVALLVIAAAAVDAQDIGTRGSQATLRAAVADVDPGTSDANAAADPLAAGAAERWTLPRVGIHLGSRHWPTHDKSGTRWNDVNPGVYFRWSNGITVGGYRNSERHNSFYAGWTWARAECGAALTLGVITGYSGGMMPMAIPSLCVFDHYRLTFLPRFDPKAASVLHLSIEF